MKQCRDFQPASTELRKKALSVALDSTTRDLEAVSLVCGTTAVTFFFGGGAWLGHSECCI